MTDTAVQLRGVSKTFGAKRAVDGLDLDIPRGSVFGLLGANGAGKTTLIRMLIGHLHPTEGNVQVLGGDPWLHTETVRRRVAYVSENMALPEWMTLESAKRVSSKLYPEWNSRLADELQTRFQLDPRTRFSKLSKGQKRSTCNLLALCQNADVLVMDEPAAGLDAVVRRSFLEQVLDVACQEDRTVVISSHILSDLERVVDRVAILRDGSLVLQGELEDLKQGTRKIHVSRDVSAEAFASHFQVLRHRNDGVSAEAIVLDFDDERLQAFSAQCGDSETVHTFALNLEDLFVELMQTDLEIGKAA